MQIAKKLIVAVAAAVAASCALGEDYTWTGEANDGGLWTTPQNWGRESGYPNGSDAVINFGGDATVSLNTGTITPIKVIKVSDGVVTINGTAGSCLKATNATAGYDELFAVAVDKVSPDIQLILNVPVDAGGLRCDKWNGGALVFRSAFTNTMNNTGGIGFLFGAGSNVLENACSFYTPNCNVVLANGPAGSGTLYLRITDGTHLTANLLRAPSRSGNAQYVDIIQEDSDTVVSIKSDIELGYNTGATPWTRYCLKDGRLHVGRDIICGRLSKGAFEMSGGTLELGGSFKTNGVAGKFVYSGGKILVPADHVGNPVPEWAELNVEPLIGAVAGATLSLDSWNRPYPIRKVGEGTMLFPDDVSMTITNDVFVNEGTLKFGSRIHLNAPRGDYTPWKIKVANGAKLGFTDLTSRLSRPLDLEIEEGGEVHLPNGSTEDGGIYMRSMLIAHKLTVGGQVIGRGTRYLPNQQHFTASDGASIAVPFVWTGAAGDGIWETAGNWEDSQLPTAGDANTIVDLSRADGQTIKITKSVGYCIGGVIANPNGSTRRVTITGGGLALQNRVNYQCAIYVGEGCELVFDCDYYQSSGTHAICSTALGGGRITFLRNYADLGHQNVAAPLMADATLVFAGTNMAMRGGTGWKYFLPGGSIEKEGRGRAVIEEGAHITATRFQCARISTSVMDEIVQRGGTLTVEDFVLGRMNSNWPSHWRQEYCFENGEITCSTGFHQGEYMENLNTGYRYTGGTFLMTGGILTTPLVKTAANSQYLRFYGGTFNLGGGGMVLDASNIGNWGSHVIIPDPVHLGGVKIRASADSVSDVPLVLDGTNGDPEIDTDGHDMTFEGKVFGSGGLVKSGLGSAIFAGECTFGGSVTVKGGSLVFGEFSSLHGGTIIVESGCTLAINGAVDAPLFLSLPAEQALTLPASASITVAALSVGGLQRTAGSYGIGGGTVIVAPPAPGAGDAVWIGPSGGRWNDANNWKDGVIPNGGTAAADFGFASIASNTTINLDEETVLKTLAFTHPEEGAKLTIGAAGGVLKIVSAAKITVQQGRTLEIAADVVMGPRQSGNVGIIKVDGGGTLRFTGKVTPESPVATLGSFQAPWVEMSGGTVDIAGEIEGVRIMSATTNILPRLVFSEGMVATNKFAPTVAWGTSSGRMFAEIVQNGGTFGLDSLNPSISTTQSSFGYLNGGRLTYTINNGLFRMNPQYPTYFNLYDERYTATWSGQFLFTVNGGEVDFCNYVFGGKNKGDQETLVLNDGGTLRFLNGFGESGGLGSLVLNGGRIESAFTGKLLADSANTLVELNGNVVFAQDDAAEQVTIESQIDGLGSIEQQGPGNLIFGKTSPGIVSASVTGGTLTFADMMQCTNCMVGANAELRLAHAGALMPGAVVSVAGSGTLNLDFGEGVLVLDRLTVGSLAVRRGEYGTGTERPLPPGLEGIGTLRVLHGAGGMTIQFH